MNIFFLIILLSLTSCSSQAKEDSVAVARNVGQEPSAAAQALFATADEAAQKGRFAEAVLAYEEVMRTEPAVMAAYFRLGTLYFGMNLPGKAEETYLQALKRGENGPDIYIRLGYIAESRHNWDQALAYYGKAEERHSSDPALHYNLGNVLAHLDRNKEALERYKRTVAMDPKHQDAFVNLSIVSFHEKAYADARFYLDKAVALGYKAPEEYRRTLNAKTF